MANAKLALIFKSIVKGQNIMTPTVVDFYRRGDYICELSTSSEPFMYDYLYGVTVVNERTGEHCVDMSKCFSARTREYAKKKAMDYLDSLS